MPNTTFALVVLGVVAGSVSINTAAYIRLPARISNLTLKSLETPYIWGNKNANIVQVARNVTGTCQVIFLFIIKTAPITAIKRIKEVPIAPA